MASPPEQPPAAPEESIDFAIEGPRTPGDSSDSDEDTDTDSDILLSPSTGSESSQTSHLPTLRSSSARPNSPPMTASSTPLGVLQNARRPAPPPSNMSGVRAPPRTTALPSEVAAKMAAFHLSRQGTPPSRPQMGQTTVSTGSSTPLGNHPAFSGMPITGLPANFQMPNMRPQPHNVVSAPAVPKMKMGGLAARRAGGGMKLPGGLSGGEPSSPASSTNGTAPQSAPPANAFDEWTKYIDTEKGELKLDKAVINSQGVKFSSGSDFSISLDEVDTLDELGKGNYGTVYKVRHTRPRMRRPGLGLAGNKLSSQSPISPSSDNETYVDPSVKLTGSGTGIVMAMKEIRLELESSKFASIIMELDILHRCLSPYIIDFYGAFFQEGAVYMCIEFMDGGSVDKLYGDGVPEGVLRKITYATTQGLKTLKDEHNIIHRDVKPTNILVNTRGQVKICDFGVSGNLVASIAKTNIGCQSYMAPERISGGGMSAVGAPGGTYSVQSDIWSLGLSIIECALGRYPYPPETYDNIFSQLSAIVDGEPPGLPEEGYSVAARDFVKGCLNKVPKLRPTYGALLSHAWLAELSKPVTISEEDEELAEVNAETTYTGGVGDEKVMGAGRGTEDAEVAAWVKNAIERKKKGLMGESKKPALHAAPLDAKPLSSPS